MSMIKEKDKVRIPLVICIYIYITRGISLHPSTVTVAVVNDVLCGNSPSVAAPLNCNTDTQPFAP